MRNPRFGDEPFVICHWDTFDNETFVVGGEATLKEAIEAAMKHYDGRLSVNGADRVEIIDRAGEVVWAASVG